MAVAIRVTHLGKTQLKIAVEAAISRLKNEREISGLPEDIKEIQKLIRDMFEYHASEEEIKTVISKKMFRKISKKNAQQS
jgi:hypothetical protein